MTHTPCNPPRQVTRERSAKRPAAGMGDEKGLTAPLLTNKNYDQPSVFVPENLLREARRQKVTPPGNVPAIADATERVPPPSWPNALGQTRGNVVDYRHKNVNNGGPRSVMAKCGRDGARPSIVAVSNEKGRDNTTGRDGARPSRKTPAHFPVLESFNRAAIVFVTVCTDGKKPILACVDAHDLLYKIWLEADRWLVGRYVVMPDHIHLFCAPGLPEFPALTGWVQYWKSLASRHWPRPEEQPIWQKSFWDTQLRGSDSYVEKWEYVRANPVRAGLCKSSEEWPFQGEQHVLPWFE